MRSRGLAGSLACCLIFAAASLARAQGKVGETAPEFPPGMFTDAGSHSLSSLHGKVVVLYFFEPS